jgi:DnaK suppressor protein
MAAKKRPAGKAPAKHSAGKAKATVKRHAASGARKSPRAPSGKGASVPGKTTSAAARKTAGSHKAAAKPVAVKKAPAISAPAAARSAGISLSAARKPPAPRILPPPRGVTGRRDSRPITSSVGLIHGIAPYQPKPGEAYMNERQLDHFRHILLAWKRELMEEVDRTVHHMQDEASNFPDPNDRATQESEFGLELRTRDRERKLLKKIDSALERIDSGSYGYCEETGEEIGLRRLEARPVATLSVEAQERREVAERQFRDREDGY